MAQQDIQVAILVIMEDVFLPVAQFEKMFDFGRNPCYNGRCISTKCRLEYHLKNK